jgi:hypothetical protein
LDFVFLLDADFREMNGLERTLTLYKHRDSAIPMGACSVFWRAIETSKSVTACMESQIMRCEGFPSGPILSQFLRGSPLLLRLDFEGFDFGEEHCRAFATIQRTDLKVEFINCTLEPKDAEGDFIEWFRHSQVVTELQNCRTGSRFLQALSGNSSVKKLSFRMIGQCLSRAAHSCFDPSTLDQPRYRGTKLVSSLLELSRMQAPFSLIVNAPENQGPVHRDQSFDLYS